MQAMQQFCLRWNNHQPNFISVFTSLLSDKTLVDVTLACEGKHLQAHRVVLSACSAYFQTLFTVNPCQHPIVILKDIRFSDLKTMVDFMYYGEVNVSQEQLPAILKIADMLKIKGLADTQNVSETIVGQIVDKDYGSPSPSSPLVRRKRLRKSSTGSGSGSTEQTSEDIVSEGAPAHSPSVKIEHVDDAPRTLSRQSLRNSQQDASTDSEPKEGSQEQGIDDLKRQFSSDSRQISYETHPISTESRQGSYEVRQLSHESRQSSTEGRQISYESRQSSQEGKQLSPDRGRQVTPQLTLESRQASHESRLSHESSVESGTTDPEGNNSNLSPSHCQMKVGSKRGRLLMRQPRIKKESDVHLSPDSEPGSPGYGSSNLLSVQPVKTERQRSEPAPSQSHSPPPHHPSLNLLTVPQPMFSARQHSFPPQSLSTPSLPSGTVFVQRQLNQSPSHKSEETGRSVSPSAVSDSVPIVRIIPESEQQGQRSNSLVYRQRSEESKRIADIDTSRPVHCPVQRSGPALGCNFCWNTTDAHGRILRRKTKFHCPECQTNLCIVPCFQQYHHKQDELTNKPDHPPSAS